MFGQNYGCSHLIVGRDHAGVGEYDGPFDAHHIFDQIPDRALELEPLKLDWTFYCGRCDGVASMRMCPHDSDERLLLSGTMLRKMLSAGERVREQFTRPEVLEILAEYYSRLDDGVEIALHRYAK